MRKLFQSMHHAAAGVKLPDDHHDDGVNLPDAFEGKPAKQGKIVIFKAWPGFHQKDKELMQRPHEELAKLARERLTFPLASFVIAAGPHCYFQYTWGWNADCGTFDWHPEFDKPLGAPKSDAKRDAKRDGFQYTREFEHASVFVNLKKKTGKID